MNNVFLGIGTNIGNREKNLKYAIISINKFIGTILKTSCIYETEPWGFNTEDQFLNMVIEVETNLSPSALLLMINRIETLLGRNRNEKKYVSRAIDIDILLYKDQIINDGNLEIPHPLMHKRKFVMVPLNEIASDFEHPVFKKSIASLLNVCNDKSRVKLFK